MKKRIFVIIAMLMAAMLLMASCSGSSGSEKEADEVTVEEGEKSPESTGDSAGTPATGEGDEETKAESVNPEDSANDSANNKVEETTKAGETTVQTGTVKPEEDTHTPVIINPALTPETTTKPSAPETNEPAIAGRESVDPPAPGVLEKVARDYYDLHVEYYQYSPEVIGTVYVEKYEGTYDGAVVVLMNGTLYSSVKWKREIYLAGYVFTYYGGNTAEVWKDGKFYSIEDAYYNGILTKEHIDEIYNTAAIVYTDNEYAYPNP